MNKPIIDLNKNWQQPTSIGEDATYAGFPWKVFTPGSLVQGGRGDESGASYFKVPASLIESANIAVVYRGMAMLLAHNQQPAYTRAASFKNPKTYNYYRWIPSAHHHDGRWLSLSEYVRTVMPNHQEPSQTTPVAKTKEYWERRRQLAQKDETTAVQYLCSCGRRHTQTIYKDLDDRPWERCPGGGIMRRVMAHQPIEPEVKYVCTCGKNHTRTTVPALKPERCPEGGEMVEAGGP